MSVERRTIGAQTAVVDDVEVVSISFTATPLFIVQYEQRGFYKEVGVLKRVTYHVAQHRRPFNKIPLLSDKFVHFAQKLRAEKS